MTTETEYREIPNAAAKDVRIADRVTFRAGNYPHYGDITGTAYRQGDYSDALAAVGFMLDNKVIVKVERPVTLLTPLPPGIGVMIQTPWGGSNGLLVRRFGHVWIELSTGFEYDDDEFARKALAEGGRVVFEGVDA